MFFKWKRKNRQFSEKSTPHVFLILGFIGAALTQEAMDIFHDLFFSFGFPTYEIYKVTVVVIWILLMILIMKFMNNVSLELGISGSNPKGDIVPRGAQGVVMLAFDLNVSSGADAKMKRILISHEGDSTQDITGIYLAINGARVSPITPLNSNGAVALRLTWPLEIEQESTVTLDVVADFSRAASAGCRHRLFLESGASLVSNLPSLFKKSKMIRGETFTVASVTCGMMTASYEHYSGADVIGGFSISVDSTEDQTMYSVTLKNRGNLSDNDFKNIYIADTSGNRLTNVVSHTVGDYVTLVFDPPYTILRSHHLDVVIHADVVSSGKIEMFLEEVTDLFGVGSLYGYGKEGQLYGSSIRVDGTPKIAQF